MYIYLISEECHGLIGIFSTVEKAIAFLKEKWGLTDHFYMNDSDENYIEINPANEDDYFSIEKKELDNPDF